MNSFSSSLLQVLDPEKQADMLDSLRIYLLQCATLLVEHAPHHIHDNNKNRNSKLRRLMTFAWPCLLSKACVDPACKYSGHLLLAHIIAKFAIHKKIVLQVLYQAPSGSPDIHTCTHCSPSWPLLLCCPRACLPAHKYYESSHNQSFFFSCPLLLCSRFSAALLWEQ